MPLVTAPDEPDAPQATASEAPVTVYRGPAPDKNTNSRYPKWVIYTATPLVILIVILIGAIGFRFVSHTSTSSGGSLAPDQAYVATREIKPGEFWNDALNNGAIEKSTPLKQGQPRPDLAVVNSDALTGKVANGSIPQGAMIIADMFVDPPNGTASAGGPAAPVDFGAVNVTLTDFEITPVSSAAPSGAPVQLHIWNQGGQVHNLSAPQLNQMTPDLAPGEFIDLDLGVLQPGTYELVCTIPGHADAGQKANLNVGEPKAATSGG